MGLLRTKITNPMATGCSYSWFPGGLHLAAGESKIVDFDPFTAAFFKKRIYEQALLRDVLNKRIVLEYSADAPCTVSSGFADASAKHAPVTPPPEAPPRSNGWLDKAETAASGDFQATGPESVREAAVVEVPDAPPIQESKVGADHSFVSLPPLPPTVVKEAEAPASSDDAVSENVDTPDTPDTADADADTAPDTGITFTDSKGSPRRRRKKNSKG